jgi:hypothetical protein
MSDIDTHKAVEHEQPEPTSIGDQSLERIAHAFETGMRRWELIIYPAMFAFVLLAAYGFYLVYSLARDVSHLSADVARMTDAVAPSMNNMSGYMGNIDQRLVAMSEDIRQMNNNTGVMTTAIYHMGASLWDMNRNISAPMGTFNSMMPWGNSEPDYVAPRPMMPPPYAYPQAYPQVYPQAYPQMPLVVSQPIPQPDVPATTQPAETPASPAGTTAPTAAPASN